MPWSIISWLSMSGVSWRSPAKLKTTRRRHSPISDGEIRPGRVFLNSRFRDRTTNSSASSEGICSSSVSSSHRLCGAVTTRSEPRSASCISPFSVAIRLVAIAAS